MKSIFKISYISLFSLVIVLTFSCISQIVGITQDTYLAQECQKKINTISIENLHMPQESASTLSLKDFEMMARERNFTESGNITYLKVPVKEVVVR